jgi:hypothetical protein
MYGDVIDNAMHWTQTIFLLYHWKVFGFGYVNLHWKGLEGAIRSFISYPTSFCYIAKSSIRIIKAWVNKYRPNHAQGIRFFHTCDEHTFFFHFILTRRTYPNPTKPIHLWSHLFCFFELCSSFAFFFERNELLRIPRNTCSIMLRGRG